MNPQLRRLILDLGPLVIFFGVLKFWNFYVATAVFMVTIMATLAIGYAPERKLSPMPLFTAAVVMIFGGLTLYLNDSSFFKLKVTFIYSLFGTMLLVGLAFNRLFIKYVFSEALELDEQGWRKLTVRMGIFFFLLAVLNEIVWRNASDDTWALAKIGFVGLTFLFLMAQLPLMLKHQLEKKEQD